VQREFSKINEKLLSRRDSMTDEVLDNTVSGYTFVGLAMTDDTRLLDPQYVAGLLELNHTVLCGRDPINRREHRKHIQPRHSDSIHRTSSTSMISCAGITNTPMNQLGSVRRGPMSVS
jgi:hypothetical protein